MIQVKKDDRELLISEEKVDEVVDLDENPHASKHKAGTRLSSAAAVVVMVTRRLKATSHSGRHGAFCDWLFRLKPLPLVQTDSDMRPAGLTRFWYPRFEGGQSQSDPDGGLVGVHHRVVVDVAVVAHSDWLVVVLVDAVERIDWLCGR